MKDGGIRKQTIRHLLGVLILSAIFNLGVVAGGFLVDDWFILTTLAGGSDPANPVLDPWRFFLEPSQSRYNVYRPMVGITYWLDWQVSGRNPLGYLISNLIFHLAGGAVLYGLARRLLPELSTLSAAGGTLIFLTFPAQVESVAWVAARSETLSWTLGSAAVLYQLWRPGKVVVVPILLLLSVLSKESAVVFGLVLLILNLWPCGGRDRELGFQGRLWRCRGLFIAGLVYLAMRWKVFGGLGASYDGRTLVERMGPSPLLRARNAIEHGLLPLPPELVEATSVLGVMIHLVWVGLLVVALCGLVVALRAREFRWVSVVLVLFAVPFALGVMANPIEPDLRNSRALYTPVAAIALMIARALSTGRRTLVVAAVLGMLACLALVSLVGWRYVECAEGVSIGADSLQRQSEALPPNCTTLVLHGLHREEYFGGLSALVGSLPFALRPPFIERRFDVEFVLGPKDGVLRGPLVEWEELDGATLETHKIFLSRRSPKGPQEFFPALPLVANPAFKAPRLRAPTEGEILRFDRAAGGGRIVQFKFRAEKSMENLDWNIVVLSERGVLLRRVVPRSLLRKEEGRGYIDWTIAMPVPETALREIRNGGSLAWSIYGVREGVAVTPAPPFAFFVAEF